MFDYAYSYVTYLLNVNFFSIKIVLQLLIICKKFYNYKKKVLNIFLYIYYFAFEIEAKKKKGTYYTTFINKQINKY